MMKLFMMVLGAIQAAENFVNHHASLSVVSGHHQRIRKPPSKLLVFFCESYGSIPLDYAGFSLVVHR